LKTKNKTRSILYYFKDQKLLLLAYLSVLVFTQVFNILAVFFGAFFLAELVAGNFDLTLMWLVAACGSLIVHEITYALYFKSAVSLITRGELKIKNDLINRAFVINSRTFSEKASGVFINRINYDPNTAMWALENVVDKVIRILTVFVTFVYIIFSNVWIGIVLFISLICLIVLEQFKNIVYEKNAKKQKKLGDKCTSITSEVVRSERDIKSLNLEGRLNQPAAENYDKYVKQIKHTEIKNMHFWSTRHIFTQIVLAIALVIGIFLVKDTALSIAAFLFIYSNRDSFDNVIRYFGQLQESVTLLKVSSNRMFEVFDESKFPIEKFGDVDINLTGNVEFKNVSFSYLDDIILEDDGQTIVNADENREKKRKTVFTDLSFKIPANKTVAFAGESGSGKTTIVSLISKLYDAEGGEILLDGVNIQQLSKQTLKYGISLVNQFPYIFDTTIKENFLMANKDATDDEIIEVAKKARLHDFIISLTNGYQTKVGEGGIKLSGGQKQRLAIARALLRKSKIIIFDESTSSLDNTTQNEITKAINNLGGGHTVIIVAHRLSTIKNADIIFFINNGVVESSGTFNHLIKASASFKKFFEGEFND